MDRLVSWKRFRIGIAPAVLSCAFATGVSFAEERNSASAKDEQAPSVDNNGSTTLASKVKEIFRARCFECHGGSATQADVDILNVDALVQEDQVVRGRPEQSSLLTAITTADEDVRMPQGSPALSPADVDLVRQWIAEGAPAFPEDVAQPDEALKDSEFKSVAGVEYVLKQILDHQRKLAADKRRNVRYFSCNHLLIGGATREELDVQRDAFAKALNHLSREPQVVQPEVVNGETATIFAVDLRDIGWNRRPFSHVTHQPAVASDINLHDLILLEYPYGILYEDSATFDALAVEFLTPAGQVRPIPYVRTDWFCSVATLPPLYHDLLQLPRDLSGLEQQLGMNVEDNLKHRKAKRAGMTVSGVSRNNRAVERHPTAHGSYWKSIDYASSKGTENIFTDPVNLHGTGGEMIFSLPNGLQAYYISDAIGKRLNEAPTSIVTDKLAEDKTVRNGLSCIRCHNRGIKDFRDDVRPAVEKITGSGHIHKREVLALYPPHDEMESLVSLDQEQFEKAMAELLGKDQNEEPLTPVSKRFLDTPLQLGTVAGELGLTDMGELKATFRQPHFTSFGLVALADAGVVRRDMWEDYFDEIVRSLGLGIPVVPVDGLSTADHLAEEADLDVRISTTRKNNVFAPGDDLAVVVENRSKSDVFIELFGTSAQGETVVIVPAGTRLESGKELRFPKTGTLKVRPVLGRELITLFASAAEFPAGQIIRAEHMADRVVHPFYSLHTTERGTEPRLDARKVLKRTLEIETR